MRMLKMYQSSKETGDRWRVQGPVSGGGSPLLEVSIDGTKTFQTWLGFGTALTEASAHVLSSLAPVDRAVVVNDYFNPEKNGFTYCRVPLGSSDFSLEPWSTVESPEAALRGEIDMTRFDALTLPVLNEIQDRAGGRVRLVVSPWSPPPFMKDNHSRLQGGVLLAEWRQAWAVQYAAFLSALAARGFETWAVTVQNEPEATQRWDSCRWTAREEAEFTADFLRPALDAAGHTGVKILLWDHNRDRLWPRARDAMAAGAGTIDGFAFHWYGGDHFDQVGWVAEAWPDKLLVFSEGCIEGGPRPGAWFTGERYAHNIIGDLNHGCQAWIDWNMALDTQGGPNHVGNFCDSPVLVDLDQKTFQAQSSFWALAHFSRAIRPGAVRLGLVLKTGMVPASVDGLARDQIEGTVWRNPDETVVLVLTNRTEADVPWTVTMEGHQRTWKGTLPVRGIQTLVWAP